MPDERGLSHEGSGAAAHLPRPSTRGDGRPPESEWSGSRGPPRSQTGSVQTEYVVLGVPSSAGAHHAGQELAPSALRRFGLVEGLLAAGVSVLDRGDIAGEVWSVDRFDTRVRNLPAVVRVARGVADAVEREVRTGRVPLVIGGDCTITCGVVAGLQRIDPHVGLLYLDGDADIVAPDRSASGILDATVVAHLLAIADTDLAHLSARHHPMLLDRQIALLGYDPSDPDSFDAEALHSRDGLVHADFHQVLSDPLGCARRAIAALAQQASSVIVHFDVDVVDSRDLPLANYPHYGTGLPLATAAAVLQALVRAPSVAALVLTEVNPTHDPDGGLLQRYIAAVVDALSPPIPDAQRPTTNRER